MEKRILVLQATLVLLFAAGLTWAKGKGGQKAELFLLKHKIVSSFTNLFLLI